MDKTISEAWEMIDSAMRSNLSVKDLPELANMIKSVECVEAYIRSTDSDKPTDEVSWLLRRIDSELQASEMYCDKWIEMKRPEYKQLAVEELRHAEQFIKMAREVGIPQSELQDAIARHGAIAARLA